MKQQSMVRGKGGQRAGGKDSLIKSHVPHTWLTNQLTMVGGKELQGEVTVLRGLVRTSSARAHMRRGSTCAMPSTRVSVNES